MATRYYDEALKNKIASWVKDPNVQILGPNDVTTLLQTLAYDNNDSPIKLPIIAISKSRDIDVQSTNKKPLVFDGLMLDATTTKTLQVNAIPIGLYYQIDVYTRYYPECDEYIRNLVFNLITYPKMTITFPYNNVNFEHNAYLSLQTPISDTSDIPQRLVHGQFTRFTLRIGVDNAYLFSLPYEDNVYIDDCKVVEFKK